MLHLLPQRHSSLILSDAMEGVCVSGSFCVSLPNGSISVYATLYKIMCVKCLRDLRQKGSKDKVGREK